MLDIELSGGLVRVTGLEPYSRAFVLARWRGRPVGTVWLDLEDGALDPLALAGELMQHHGPRILRAIAADVLPPEGQAEPDRHPSATVAVCTRDREDDLRRCLAALARQEYAPAEVLVVDNASRGAGTRDVCREFPVRYVREDVPGLNWARRRAVLEAGGEIVVFTDDDACADPRWLAEMLRPFAVPTVAATSGLALPLELETDGQEGFERSCPMSRGFEHRTFDARTLSPLAAANAGLGASMAVRRSEALRLRLFEVDLDAGTAARSGGDTYAFYRLLASGQQIVYTPDALVWHRHRRTRQELVDVLRNYSIGTYVFLFRCLFLHGEFNAITAGAGWFLKHHVKQLLRATLGRRGAQPASITWAEIGGVLRAPAAFARTLQRERRLRRHFAMQAGRQGRS